LPDLLDREQVSAAQRRRRVQRGEWRRLDGGILVIAGVPETFEMLATAALARHPTAALSHQSALRIHGTETATSAIHLSVQAGGQTRAVGAVLHQTLLEERDVVVRKGFRVTTLERTLVDLGATMGQRELQRCIEDHIVRGRTTFARLESTFLRLATRGRSGIARTRAVLAALDGEPPTESELEAMFQRLLIARNLPLPTRQVTFEWTDEESGRVDCWYPDARVIVELDGRRFHARLAAFERDRRRDQAALLDGIPTLRFTHHQLTDEPEWVERVLRSVLAGRS
jgi:predicted transcriptional regulator of viral defense system